MEEAYGRHFFFGVVAFGGKKKLKVKHFHVSTLLGLRVTSERVITATFYANESSRHDSIPTLQTCFVHFIISAPLEGIRQTRYTYFREKTQAIATNRYGGSKS